MWWIFFNSISIQFAVWYWGISLLCLMNFEWDNHFFLIHSNEMSHDKHLFSLYDYQHTSNQSLFPTTMTVLSTFLLNTSFHLPTIWSVNHFHLWSHHRHLKIHQMNILFLSISYLQFIPSWDWRREGECVRRV